jgi:hypothetical protein
MATTGQPGKAEKAEQSGGQFALVVLDGWGFRAQREGNAIALARTPT